jgi:tRNA pseudouridine55 synthase
MVERAAREVVIHALVASDFAPGARAEATLHVSCGGGTYIRTLCADIGTALGVGGHMKSLVREAVGRFRLADALPLADLTPETVRERLLPLARVLDLPTVAVDDAANERLGRGQSVAAGDLPAAETVALLHRGRLRALARLDKQSGTLLPFKVFPVQDDADDDENSAPRP